MEMSNGDRIVLSKSHLYSIGVVMPFVLGSLIDELQLFTYLLHTKFIWNCFRIKWNGLNPSKVQDVIITIDKKNQKSG